MTFLRDDREGGGTGKDPEGANAGGGAPGSEGAGTDGGGAKPGSEGANQGGGAGGDAAGADFKPPEFRNLDEAHDAWTKLAQEKAEIEKARKKLEGDHTNLKKKVGDLSNKTSEWQKFHEAINSPDEETRLSVLKGLAKEMGVKLPTGGKTDHSADPAQLDLDKLEELIARDPQSAQEMIEKAKMGDTKAEMKRMLQEEMQPYQRQLMEQAMSTKYEDWGDKELVTARKMLNAQIAAGNMPYEEVLHLALKGGKLGDAHKQGFEEGYAKAEKDIAKKMQESTETGGGGDHEGQNNKKPEGRVYLGNVLRGMHSVRPWQGASS